MCLQLQVQTVSIWGRCSNPLNWSHLWPLGFVSSHQPVKHTSLQLSLSNFQHFDLHPSVLILHNCFIGGCRNLQARGGAAVALQSAGCGLQWGTKRTRGSTPSSAPAEEAEAATVRQKVCSVLWQGRRPRPDTGGAQGVPGSLRWVTSSSVCVYV